MAWTRAELKFRAKTAFKRNYWKCVLVAFILSIISASGSSNVTEKLDNYNENRNSRYYQDYDTPYYNYYNFSDSSLSNSPSVMSTSHYSSGYAYGQMLSSAIIMLLLIASLIALVLSFLVFNPLQVGGCAFFMENAWIDSAGPGLLLQAFKRNYVTTILTMFLRGLYIVLWTFLLIIPGFIKAYEYRMVPYLLADHPEMSRHDIFQESKRLMTGNKWDAFVLDLSFIGWNLLSGLTLGILGVFYVNPYIHATNAELYLALKRGYN
ncbi:MAG: DUF975 family protein [Butyrivibrio sp.]|nr:DUF975 family protein [Muribaculum sp.]MCM1553545.1 DUF975 family protein [Butyrivibrio sp.]